LSLVFDARKQAEQSKRAREAKSAAPQAAGAVPTATNEQPGVAPQTTETGATDWSRRWRRNTVAGAVGGWRPGAAVAGHISGQVGAPVRSLLRAAGRGSDSAEAGAANAKRGGTIESATLIWRREPNYPPLARQNQISGSVEVQFRISPEGKVYDVKPLKGHAILAEAAVEAVKSWFYDPARLNGAPVDSPGRTNLEFKLR
jgi:TonB family protein